MQSPMKSQSYQSQQSTVVVDESTFTYLPKVSKVIGLSTLTIDQVRTTVRLDMDQVPSKKLKNYQHFGLFLHGLDPVAFDRKVDPLPRSCFNCWSHKHRLLDCPKRLIGIFCCNCGRRYVRIDNCPRCSRVFWELDHSAREWLISYIPEGGQEDTADCGEKYWSKCVDETVKSRSRKSNVIKQKRRKGYSKGVELSECESVSRLVSRTTDADEGDNDEWWAGGKSKDNVEETLTQKQRTGVASLKSPSTSEKHSPSEKNLQKFHQLANLKDNNDFDYQENLLGDSLNVTSIPFKCHTTPHVHVEDRHKVTDCNEEDLSKYGNGMSENISGECDTSKLLRKEEDSQKSEELVKYKSEFVSRTTEGGKSNADNCWAGESNKEETVEERLNLMSEEEEDNHENTLVNEKDKKDEDNVQMTLTQTESDCENQFNSLENSSATLSEEDEEDYDNIIVDEDEQLEESSVVGSTVRDFLDLLKAAKYLPLQQQNRIVLRFASECKKKF